MTIAYSTRSWLFLIPLIPSTLWSIFVLYYSIKIRTFRTTLCNHVLIIVNFFGFIFGPTVIVWQVYFYWTGTMLSLTSAFCYAWVFIDSTLCAIMRYLIAWASIERHIVIFHSTWFATKMKRVLFHYLPLMLCILYPSIFYGVIIFIVPCDFQVDYSEKQCGVYDCITRNHVVSIWDSVVDYLVPVFSVAIFNIALIIRVVYSRYRVRQRIQWKQYRNMTAQLLPISALYIIVDIPATILYIAYTVGLPWTVGADFFSDIQYLWYYAVIFTPLIASISLPDLRAKYKNIFLFCRRQHIIQPEVFVIARRNIVPKVIVPFIPQ